VCDHPCYSVLDLKAAFNNVTINPADRSKTSFKTHRGIFQYNKMPFGLRNAPSQFQRYIENILADKMDHCRVYIDDIIIFSNTEDHQTLLGDILLRLSEHHIPIATAKCQLTKRRVRYLGFLVGFGKVEPEVDQKTISDWPEPTNKKELQRFLGLAAYYAPFAPNLAISRQPLLHLTGKDKFYWEPVHQIAFSQVKWKLLDLLSMHRFRNDEPVDIYTDASLFAIGCMMYQNNKPVKVISRSLTKAERNYSTTEREMLGFVYALKKWRHFLESTRKPITIYTDHKSLTQELNKDHTNRRVNRWLEVIMPYRFQLKFIEGKNNPADIPSRRPDYTNAGERMGGGSGNESSPSEKEPSDPEDNGSDYDWEANMGDGHWSSNGGSPQWVPD